MAKQFILYQEQQHSYSAHALVPALKAKALPTRVATFHPATEKALGEIHKKVRDGYHAWLVPDYSEWHKEDPYLILLHCALSKGTAKKIA